MRISSFIFSILVGLFFVSKLYGQKIQIREENSIKSISFVSAYNENSKEWYISDSLGKFSFNFSKPALLTFDVIGFENKSIAIFNDTTIFLKQKSIQLAEVIVDSKHKNTQLRTSKSKNGLTSFYSYKYSNLLGLKKNIASLISLSDSLNKIEETYFDAKIYGNKNNQFARLKIYRVNYQGEINSSNYKKALTNFEEIYSYELKDIYPNSNTIKLSFILPNNIILKNGNYLFSLEITPSQNPSQKLIVNFSKDKYIHTFFRMSKSWSHDFDDGKFLNMKIKVEYEVL